MALVLQLGGRISAAPPKTSGSHREFRGSADAPSMARLLGLLGSSSAGPPSTP
jgi:hypothetical protein